MPPPIDKKSKELDDKVEFWFFKRGPVDTPEPMFALEVMQALSDGARCDRALQVLIMYDSPLPLLDVSRSTDLVTEQSWEEWGSHNLNTLEDAQHFWTQYQDIVDLQSTPAWARMTILFVQES